MIFKVNSGSIVPYNCKKIVYNVGTGKYMGHQCSYKLEGIEAELSMNNRLLYVYDIAFVFFFSFIVYKVFYWIFKNI